MCGLRDGSSARISNHWHLRILHVQVICPSDSCTMDASSWRPSESSDRADHRPHDEREHLQEAATDTRRRTQPYPTIQPCGIPRGPSSVQFVKQSISFRTATAMICRLPGNFETATRACSDLVRRHYYTSMHYRSCPERAKHNGDRLILTVGQQSTTTLGLGYTEGYTYHGRRRSWFIV